MGPDHTEITVLCHTSLFAELVQTHSVCENVAQHQQEAKHTLADPVFLSRHTHTQGQPMGSEEAGPPG